MRGTFELEVTCSEDFVMNMIPDTRSRTLAGDWVDGLSGGSHVCPAWKKNPRFLLDLEKMPGAEIATVKISLSKCGHAWKNLSRLDAVGCMIGFYVFITSDSGETRQIYESIFAPTEEVCTDPEFTLDFLPPGKSYVIMPTTFAEGKVGSFVLSVSADTDFALTREGSSHK